MEHQQYLSFDLSGETFAIGILHIKEIIEYGRLTVVPMMPPPMMRASTSSALSADRSTWIESRSLA